MNIIIAGDGKVGYTLAQYLSEEGHDVTILDRNQAALRKAQETLDVLCVRGSSANVRSLIEAGVEKADVLSAATTNDESNMVCCLAAKMLGAKYTCARIRDPEYTESLTLLQKEMGIDLVVNPERTTAMEISRIFRFPFATTIEAFAHGRVEMVAFRVEGSEPIVGMALHSMPSSIPRVLYCAIERDGHAIIPDGSTRICVGDRVHVAADFRTITDYFRKLGKNVGRVKSAMLIGGGHISYYLAKIVAGMGMKLTLVEIQSEKCARLAEDLGDDDVRIICGDGTDQELLQSEAVQSYDALVCLTDRDEENLITGLYGVKKGVDKVIVKVNRLSQMDVIRDMGIDSVVSPRSTTANAILRSVRALAHAQASKIEKVYRIVNDQAEALEFTALENAPYLHVPLSQLHIKKGVLVAVIVRNRRIIIPFGGDHIEAGDTVILVSEAGKVLELTDAFTAEARA